MRRIFKTVFLVVVVGYSCATHPMQSSHQRADIDRPDAFAWIADHVAAHVREAHHEAQVRAHMRRVWRVSQPERLLIAQFRNLLQGLLPPPVLLEQYKRFFRIAVDNLYVPLIKEIIDELGVHNVGDLPLDALEICLRRLDQCIRDFRDRRSPDLHVILFIIRYLLSRGATFERCIVLAAFRNLYWDYLFSCFINKVAVNYGYFEVCPVAMRDLFETIRAFIDAGASLTRRCDHCGNNARWWVRAIDANAPLRHRGDTTRMLILFEPSVARLIQNYRDRIRVTPVRVLETLRTVDNAFVPLAPIVSDYAVGPTAAMAAHAGISRGQS